MKFSISIGSLMYVYAMMNMPSYTDGCPYLLGWLHDLDKEQNGVKFDHPANDGSVIGKHLDDLPKDDGSSETLKEEGIYNETSN
jgi:hypothetical protein